MMYKIRGKGCPISASRILQFKVYEVSFMVSNIDPVSVGITF